MKRVAIFASVIFLVAWIVTSIILFSWYWGVLDSWLGWILGAIVAFVASPGLFIFPMIYWLVEGTFPVYYFELLGICAISAIGAVALWSFGASD